MSLYSWPLKKKPGLTGGLYKVPSLYGLLDPNKTDSDEVAPVCQSVNDEIKCSLQSLVGGKRKRTSYAWPLQ